jgi:hypothetical protein
MEFMIVDKNIQATSNEEDEMLTIIGIANTGQRDLVGDVLTNEALEDICRQATKHNLHLDHDTSLDGVLGPITSAELTTDGVEIRANIVNTEYAKKIRELLSNGANLGMSVSGVTDTTTHNLTSWDLTEISLTPLPCDQGTMGSVRIAKSFAEVVKQTMETNTMAEEQITLEQVIELINEAFNERREEFLEAIRQELKNEYDVVINELRERIESIEATATEEVAEAEEEEVVDEVVAEEEEDVVEEGENFLEGIEQAKAEAEAVEPEEEEEEDDEEVDVEKTITDIINKKLDEIFTNKKSDELHFKYEEEAEESVETETTKKRFTPRELAELFTQ